MNKFHRTILIQALVILALVFLLSGCQPASTLPSLAAPTESTEPPTMIPNEPPTRVPSAIVEVNLPATQALPTPESYPVWWMNPTPTSQVLLEVTKTLDVRYTNKKFLDVYRPVRAGDWPVVVIFHGAGDIKEFWGELATAIASHGAVVFVPSRHTGAPEPGVKMELTGVEDAACSVRFARAHASEYGGKVTRLVVVGHLEGAMQGALMMLAGDEFHGDCLTQQGSAMPDAFLGLDGLYDPIPYIPGDVLESQPEAYLRIDPFTYIGRVPERADIIFLLFVGSYLTAQPQAQAFRDALESARYSVELVQIPGIDHNGFMKPLPETVDAVFTLIGP